MIRDMFKHYSNTVVEFFKDVDKFRQRREDTGITDKSEVEKYIPILLSKVEKMTNQVDTILSNKALSLKIKVSQQSNQLDLIFKVLRQKIDEKWQELRNYDQEEMLKIKAKRQALFNWFLPRGSRGVMY